MEILYLIIGFFIASIATYIKAKYYDSKVEELEFLLFIIAWPLLFITFAFKGVVNLLYDMGSKDKRRR